MRFVITLAIASVIALIPVQSTYALSPKPQAGTIFGKVHHNGKAVPNILVEVMVGSCFAPVYKVLSTNKAGFYRVDNVRANTPVHVGVNGFSKSDGGLNKLYNATCGKGVSLRAGQLNRRNIALESKRDNKQQQCVAAGGSWEFITRGFKGCNYTYSDGDKACTDSRQCQSGACLATSTDRNATSGICPATTANKNSSCNGWIRNGRWFPKPCI